MTNTEVAQIKAARKAAQAAGLALFEKAGRFLLYRLCQPRNILVASTASADRLKRLVAKAATTVPKAA